MALGQYRIKVVPVLDTASLQNQLQAVGANGKSSQKAGMAAGNTYANSFGRAVKERLKYSVANFLIYGTQAAIKDMVANVKELDKAQTELKKVSDLSGKSLEDYTARAYKMGSTVAKTGTEIVQAATEFKKQGFDAEMALQLSGIASQFQNIADTEIDAATAAKFINSQIKAFGKTEGFKELSSDAERATKVIDTVNEVANNFGVGTNDLQMALTKTGAAMKGYGNSYGETIALITAGTEMLPNQASKVARGWRTIGANILKLAQNEETLEAANGKVNVSLRDSQGNMKSTYDILKDLHEGVEGQSVAWHELSQEEQSSISLLLAGKTQTEVFKSTMDNFTQAVKANEVAQEAQGSAARENARYLDSIQGHVASFQSAWEQLSYHIVNSDMIKAFVDLGTNAVKAIDKIFMAFDKLPGKYSGVIGTLATTLGSLFAGKKLFNLVTGLLQIGSAAAGIGNTARSLSRVADVATDVADIADDMTDLADAATDVGSAAAVAGSSTGGLASTFGALGSAILPLVPALLAVGGAIAYSHHQYKESFAGKREDYLALGDEILQLEIAIEDLQNKEGELTAEEESRLKVLQMQLDVLKQQEELKKKQLTKEFNEDAKEKMRGTERMVQGEKVVEREDTTGEKYLKATKERYDLQKKIQHLEDEARQHPLTEEQTKQLEQYNKELDKVFNSESLFLEKLLEEHEALADVDYGGLDAEGKSWYDNIHGAYLQATSDIEEVRDAVGQTVSLFGSAQFDEWDIDVGSLKSADELAGKIKEKIDALGEEEEIAIYARDEAGVIVDEITKKKSDLTDDEWNMVIDATTTGNYAEIQKYVDQKPERKEVIFDFVPVGAEGVRTEADNAARDRVAVVDVIQQGAEAAAGVIDEAAKKRDVNIQVKQTGADTVKNTLASIKDKVVNVTIKKKSSGAQEFATGKRKGEQGGTAWLGDEGSASNPKPELVVGEDGAYLAGTQGWELYNVKSSDTVYTYTQTKKLLGGKQKFSLDNLDELPRFAKGKKKKKSKKKKQQEKYDKALKNLDHKDKVNYLTDDQYYSQYASIYNKYKKYLTTDQKNAYTEWVADYNNRKAKDEAERRIGILSQTGRDSDRDATISAINNSALSADEKKDYIAKAYQTTAEYNLKEYQNGKDTRQKILDNIQSYYNTRGQYDEEYYKMLDNLREADKKRELERLKELEEKESNKLSYLKKYAEQQKSYYEKQIQKEEEEANELEKLVELQNELNNAKKTMVRVYREGVGFVYEQDTQAIKEAQKALDDYNKTQKKTEIDSKVDEWQAVIDLIGELEDLSSMKELELALGITGASDLTGGDIGTDLTKWNTVIKGIIAAENGYKDIIEVLNKTNGADIESLLGSVLASGAHQISSSTLDSYFSKHSFASGTLNAPAGLSLIGENGAELAWLNKGSAVFPNSITKNLMEWGRYNPAQVLDNASSSSQNQVFNFDKIVLPNVRNADDFYRELQSLPNRAIQQSTLRV